MTTRTGHVASLIIAFIFALLLASAWLPSSLDRGHNVKLVDTKDITHFIKSETTRKSEPARSEPSTATQSTAAPQIVAPPTREEKKVEKPMDMEWLKNFFCDIKFTDILSVIFVGLIWWNTHNIWKALYNLNMVSAGQSLELTRAAAAMEKLVRTLSGKAKPAPAPKKANKKGSA